MIISGTPSGHPQLNTHPHLPWHIGHRLAHVAIIEIPSTPKQLPHHVSRNGCHSKAVNDHRGSQVERTATRKRFFYSVHPITYINITHFLMKHGPHCTNKRYSAASSSTGLIDPIKNQPLTRWSGSLIRAWYVSFIAVHPRLDSVSIMSITIPE